MDMDMDIDGEGWPKYEYDNCFERKLKKRISVSSFFSKQRRSEKKSRAKGVMLTITAGQTLMVFLFDVFDSLFPIFPILSESLL